MLGYDERGGRIVFRSRPPFDSEPVQAQYPRELQDVGQGPPGGEPRGRAPGRGGAYCGGEF